MVPYIGRPEPGFYKRKRIRGGRWVPAKFEFGPPDDNPDADVHEWEIKCWLEGVRADPYEQWPSCLGRPIDEKEYLSLLTDDSSPFEVRDLKKLPPVF